VARADEVHDDNGAELRSVKESALRMLTAREHSTFELKRKLAARGHGRGAVERVVEGLADRALVSDRRFVEAFVRTRIERGHGPIRIRAMLRERGVDDELIDDAVTQSAAFWLECIERVRRKRFANVEHRVLDHGEWTRQARFLSQRGFPSDLIYRALGDRD
jgi:regulatory protein